VVLQPLFDAAETIRLIEQERISFMNGRPHQWARMVAEPGYAAADLSSLKHVTRGEMLWEHPTVDTSWKMPMAFGTTETMSIVTSVGDDAIAHKDDGSAGVPLPGNILKIVNPETGKVVPVGERGEVCITMIGYIGKTAEETFDDEGFYCTGDGGYVSADGHLFWEGRLNDIIKTGGANVSPQEVDEVIAKYPGVKRVQTVGVPHDTLSEMVVSCIVAVNGATLEQGDIIKYLKEQLASFKVPKEVLFFTEEEFPLTGNEKVKAADVKKLACNRLGVEVQQVTS
jgi:fatty-acyl-CoA synthase